MAWYADRHMSMGITDKIAADTKGWRSTADRIMAYWDTRLAPNPDACILATQLLDDFNDWLERRGHKIWPMETFSARFLAHEYATSNAVTKAQTKRLAGLSQRFPQMDGKSLPERATVYLGVEFVHGFDFGPKIF
jgi:putative DNA primase/helicase